MTRRMIRSLPVRAAALGLLGVLAAPAQAVPTFTGSILLNAHDLVNVLPARLSDQHGGTGYHVGRHDTVGRWLDGGNDRPWLPAGITQDIIWQARYTQPLTLDKFVVTILNDSDEVLINSKARIEYTTDPAGLTGWTILSNNIGFGTTTRSTLGGDFAAVTAHAVRFVLPKENHESATTPGTAGTWAPYLGNLQTYGTNTLAINNARFNLLPAFGTVVTGGTSAWNAGNNPAGVKDQDMSPRALWHSGTLPADAFIRFDLSQAFSISRIWMVWEGLGLSFRPSTYDVWTSTDGVNFQKAFDNHAVPANGALDTFALIRTGVVSIRLDDFTGAAGGHVILHEAMIFSLPEPASLGLLTLGVLALLRRRR